MYRQGDILLRKLELTIENNKPLDASLSNTNVLMEGSMTGHNHRIVNGAIYKLKDIDNNGVFAYVVAFKDCKLVHDEHKTIDLPEGTYEARRQMEVTGYVSD